MKYEKPHGKVELRLQIGGKKLGYPPKEPIGYSNAENNARSREAQNLECPLSNILCREASDLRRVDNDDEVREDLGFFVKS